MRSGASGDFLLCGVPLGVRVYVRAEDGNGESDAIPVVVDPTAPRANVALELDVIEQRAAGAKPFAEPPGAEPLRITAPRSISLGNVRSNTGRGTIVGLVVAKESDAPLPYADLLVEPSGISAFTSESGSFRLLHAPVAPIRIRVRRLGYLPATLSVQPRADGTDTVRIALDVVPLRLNNVRVSDAVCPDRRSGTIDTSVVTILTQVQLNSERARLMAREHPFEMVLQRMIGNEGFDPYVKSRRRVDTVQVDTVSATLDHDWRYEPGALVRRGGPVGDPKLGTPDRMVVPQLVDFAEPAFIGAHCFKYAGVQALDGQRMLRVDYQPAKGVREEIRGSLYLDTLTYQMRRSVLTFERNSPRKAGDIWLVRVDTWFRDVAPTLPVIERILHRTTLPIDRRNTWAGEAAIEEQQLIHVRFLGRPPR